MTDNERIERLNEIVENMKNTIHSSCDVHLFIDDFIATVDLINRQKAKIENLGEKIVMQMGLITEQKAEIEKLEEMIELGDYSSYSAHLAIKDRQRKNAEYTNELKAEIERLQAMVDAELDTIHNLGDDYERVLEEENELVKTAKTEAIKEFVRRLKWIYRNHSEFEQIYARYLWYEVDNLIKEMTE